MEANVRYVPGDALQEQQRLMRHTQLMQDKRVKKAWKQYRKSIGKDSVHMPMDMWLDRNYPEGLVSEGAVRQRYRHSEASSKRRFSNMYEG